MDIRGLINKLKESRLPFVKENSRQILQFFVAALFLAIGVWFLKHQKSELHDVKAAILQSKWLYISLGVFVTILYVVLQGVMYCYAFRTVRSKVPLWDNIVMFLKRNFISVFLPAGGVTSLAFFTSSIEKRGVSKSKISFASTIYGFLGILSVVLIAIPIFAYSMANGMTGASEIVALGTLIVMLLAIYVLYRSIARKERVYSLLVKLIPSSEVFLDDLISQRIDVSKFWMTLAISVIIDLVGISHLYIAMLALGFTASVSSAMLAYLVSVVFLIVSPFMRGLGAIEVSMAFILTRFGFRNVDAIAVTLLYRFFEFWLPLFFGIVAFLIKPYKLLLRILPAILLFGMGVINIISVLTPALNDRVQHLRSFIPVEAINASNYFIIVAGLFMLLTATFLLKGLRSAWWFAVFLTVGSVIGHITKAIDYEEALTALFVLAMLVISRRDYNVKGNPRFRYIGVQAALFSCLAVMIYGVIGFYFIDKHHLNVDFSMAESIKYTLLNFFVFGSSDLIPNDAFARHFIHSINISGILSLSFVFYTLIRPYVFKHQEEQEHRAEKARMLLEKYGSAATDYFKIYRDKLFFFSEDENAFLAYRVAGSYAVVLDNPVAANAAEMASIIRSFDKYCYENGLKSLYYRVPEKSLPVYESLKKKSLFMGQEAVVNLETFTLSGRSRGTLRNAFNKVADKGYTTTVHTAPVKDGLLQKLKSVSDEWLHETGRSEIIFSQGMFRVDELKNQTILTVENSEEKIVAFLNVIPDYAEGELTYDIMRKTEDAPNGVMMYLLIKLFEYAKQQGFKAVNLGFAPMSGIESPQNITEKSMRFAYEKIRSFSHYKGMRDFKDRFYPEWYNRYLIYDNDFDLINVPSILMKVIKP